MRSFGASTRPVAAVTNGHRPRGAQSAYRVLRSNLQVALGDIVDPVVVVTSAGAGEGKTSTCVGLAQALAAAGSHVVLVDLALDHPTAHRLLGAGNEFGATDVLRETRDIECCLRYVEPVARDSTGATGMFFLAAGPPVAESSELLAGPRTGRLLARLARGADIVLVDSPPVLASADALAITRAASGAILVVDAGRTTIPVVQRAKDALSQHRTPLLGAVLNRFDSSSAGSVYGDAAGHDGGGH